jgi:transcriptional regulator with XRE-family HTH domain
MARARGGPDEKGRAAVNEHISNRRADDVDKYIGQQLRVRRLMMGISQERLAKELGVSFQQIQKYESGVNRISARALFYIAQILEVSVEYFFKGMTGTIAPPDEGIGEDYPV